MLDVMIVEDDPIAADMLAHALETAGHRVHQAANGVAALAQLRRGPCRLVISDWEMPEMDGVELCRAIRSEDFDRYVYVILLSCREGAENIIEGLGAGADDFITKPFNPGELAVRMQTGQRILSLETRDLVIFSLAKLAESRDPETGAHLNRVRSYSRRLAVQLASLDKYREKIDAAYIRRIFQTSPLHDIGKVGIPDHVLLKPGRLDDQEFEIMKTHARQGAETLDQACRQYPEAEFLRMARDIARSHHERWDGTGYPDGLRGTEIPLCARIFALADVYDALVSKRVYKEAFTHSTARGIILESKGTHFDPDVVEAFLASEQDFIGIADSNRDRATPAA